MKKMLIGAALLALTTMVFGNPLTAQRAENEGPAKKDASGAKREGKRVIERETEEVEVRRGPSENPEMEKRIRELVQREVRRILEERGQDARRPERPMQEGRRPMQEERRPMQEGRPEREGVRERIREAMERRRAMPEGRQGERRMPQGDRGQKLRREMARRALQRRAEGAGKGRGASRGAARKGMRGKMLRRQVWQRRSNR